MADQSDMMRHSAQRRYWQEFIDLKRDAFYMKFYYGKTEKIDRYISCLSAIASSSAIAGWVLWHGSITIFGVIIELSFIWSAVVMASHVLTAIKEHLPYKKRLHSLSGASKDLESLAITMESQWFNISYGILSEEEIHNIHIKMKQQKGDVILKNLSDISLPLDNSLVKRADSATIDYVNSFYGSNHG